MIAQLVVRVDACAVQLALLGFVYRLTNEKGKSVPRTCLHNLRKS